MLVLRLSRGGLALLLLPGAAAALPGSHVLAAIHAAVAIGVGAAIGVSAVALLSAMLGLAVLGVGTVAVMLGMATLVSAMALMLGVTGMTLRCGSRWLGGRRGDEGESRCGGDKNGLHDESLLMDWIVGARGRGQSIRTVAEAADRRRD